MIKLLTKRITDLYGICFLTCAGVREADKPVFEDKGYSPGVNRATNLEDAAVFLGGQVKDLERIGAVLLACWDWTAELIPEKWSP